MESLLKDKKRMHQSLLSFPPFFTLQEHEQSRKKQIIYWGQIIHTYCREKGIINSSIDEIRDLPITQDKSSLITKRLSKVDIIQIMKELERIGCLQFQIGNEKILISHFSPYEMADDMYRWAKQNYLIGDVETIYFISEGQKTTAKEKFYNQPKQILIKVIEILEKQNKALKIQIDSNISVKFL